MDYKGWVVLWSLWAARLVLLRSPLVRLRQGVLRGELSPDGSHYRYFSIPYASSQRLYRFKAPGAAPPWDGVFEAVNEHVKCPQLYGSVVVGQEDCLVLNVYTPARAPIAPLPVMVFLHGGSFKEGSGARMLYGPDYLVAHNIILVTINYRISVEGFLCLGIKEASGNTGLKDQVAALKWVRRNIEAFRGDPDNVTLFGESASAGAVSFHLVSPLSRGLFHRAIIQSGSSVATWARQPDPLGVAIALAKALGYSTHDPQQLYNILVNENPATLLTAKMPKKKGLLEYLQLPFIPCVETQIEGVEAFITDTSYNIFSRGDYYKVPVIIGANNEEGYYFSAAENCESLRTLEFKEALPNDLYFPSESERETAAEKVRQLYMDDDQVSWETIVKLSKMHGEPYINYPVMVTTELLLQSSGAPVYSYVFEHDGWRNIAKLLAGPTFWTSPGATHADDLPYLFRFFPLPSLFEADMINIMTTFWTNFAKYGEPGKIGDLSWPAAGNSTLAMWLSSTPRVAPLAHFRPQHMDMWRTLYSKYRDRHN